LKIIKEHAKKIPLATSFNIEEVVSKTEGLSWAGVEQICREAEQSAIIDKSSSITSKHFEAAFTKLKPNASRRTSIDSDVNLDELAKKTDGYTGADIEGVCREAGMNAIRENAERVGAKHFEAALETVKPTISKQHLERIKKFVEGEWTMYR
jgi:SpoVK/Ycf46/Vps4 family AAA+-type ATPase